MGLIDVKKVYVKSELPPLWIVKIFKFFLRFGPYLYLSSVTVENITKKEKSQVKILEPA